MATQQQIYETRILLNSEQAKKEITALEKKVEDLKRKRQEALDAGDTKSWQKLNKEVEKHETKLKGMQGRLQSINKTLDNMSAAGPKQLKETIKDINALLNSGAIERGSRQWDSMTASLKQANTELAKIKNESKASQPVLARLFKFLNDSWGGVVILFESITRLSASVRSSVGDYAAMEEEMANVRKFTGLADEKVRELNEDLKKMDSRTGRDQLNQLAGSAGRLGKQAKKDVMEFVEGADMINVALGEDLGDGAVEKIGKLAMAFGEDKKKGLKGAMLSTGSAINELVQNSSAQAGYLVDFTARVAGFGKQLGLTQAQIMGFGTVMDENLLRDEMAATAFGNMLTKMQTDTEKFAKIAGMNVKEFTDLLNKDANGAVLALADSLKRADPQTMMKMLDSMGLDGSRAVGVLSTLADKIDDVRKHQERATRAYAEGTSVQNEFNIMNNTVQAKIDKCKKKFKEMTIELGERLLPVVQYTITGGSMLAKTLSILTSFVYDNWKAIVILSAQIGVLTVMWKAHTVWLAIVDTRNKAVAASTAALTAAQTLLRNAGVALHAMWALLTKGVQGYIVVMRAAKLASLTNPWAALATVLTVVGVAIYGVVKAWGAHTQAVRNNMLQVKEMRAQQQLEADLNKKVNESIAEQKTLVERLSRIIHSNAYTIDERRSAIRKLQGIIPDYHASINNEGKLYNDNSTAIRQYIKDLSNAALAEAIYQKKVEINQKKLELNFKQNRIENSLKAVQAYRDTQQQTTEEMVYENGSVTKKQHKTKSAEESDRQQRIHEQRLADVKSETKVVEAEEKYIDQVLEKNKKVNALFTKKTTSGTTKPGTTNPVTTPEPYQSDSDRKKAAREAKKQQTEELKALREQSRQIKAETDQRLAEEAVSYSLGLTNYRDYIEKRKKIQLEGIKERKALFEQGSTEYLRLDAQEKMLLAHGDEEARKLSLKEKEREHSQKMAMLKSSFYDERFAAYHNEQALNEMLFQEEMAFLQWKKDQAVKGSLEEMQLEWEIADRSAQHQEETRRDIEERLLKIRTDYLHQSNDMQRDIELNALKDLYDKKLLLEEEYQMAKLAIEAKYAKDPAQVNKDKFTENVNNGLAVAQGKAGDANTSNPWTGDLTNYLNTNEMLKQLYEDDKLTHAEYLAAKAQNLSEFLKKVIEKYGAVFEQVTAVYNGINNYAKACSDYEVAVVTKNYDKQIEAAGKNEKKRKKLEEKKQKEIAAIKTKANKRAMKIEIAQALASTAMGAINAYASAAKVPLIGYILAPIAAAAAVAAGMLQVATIKKQHETEEMGYYSGGFTGGKRFRKEAGVVHEGEFVANHQAVQNPAILPFLNFLDQAQRNNTVGALTAEDVSRSMGVGGSAQVITPIVNVQTDNEELRDTLEQVRDTQDRLATQLEQGIGVDVPIEGENGIYRKFKRYENLLKNK